MKKNSPIHTTQRKSTKQVVPEYDDHEVGVNTGNIRQEDAVIPYDEKLLEYAGNLWTSGDWASLSKIDCDTLQYHPDRIKLALFVASSNLQHNNISKANQILNLIKEWGGDERLVSKILIAGVYKSLGNAALAAGQEQRALRHFEFANTIATPGFESRSFAKNLAEEQIKQQVFHSVDSYATIGMGSSKGLGNGGNIEISEEIDPNRLMCLGEIDGAKQALRYKREVYKKWVATQFRYCPNFNLTPLVSIIMATCRPLNIEKIVNNITCQNYSNREVVIVSQNYSVKEIVRLQNMLENNGLCRVKIIEDNSDTSLGIRQNNAIKHSQGEFWAKMDDDDWYFPNYLHDIVITMQMGDYDVIGKNSVFYYLDGLDIMVIRNPQMHNIVNSNLRGATLFARNNDNENLRFADVSQGEDSALLKKAKNANLKIYATDPFNMVVYRSADTNLHTWTVNHSYLLDRSQTVYDGFSRELAFC